MIRGIRMLLAYAILTATDVQLFLRRGKLEIHAGFFEINVWCTDPNLLRT